MESGPPPKYSNERLSCNHPGQAKSLSTIFTMKFIAMEKKINHGGFMTRLRAGTLPLPCLRRFLRGVFLIEVVALNAVSYYVHLPSSWRISICWCRFATKSPKKN